MNKKLHIISKYDSFFEAFNAANVNISYNPVIAREAALSIDLPNRLYEFKTAFIIESSDVDRNELWYIIECYDGLRILNKFNPFFSVLDNYHMIQAIVFEKDIILITDVFYEKLVSSAKTL